MDVGILLGHFQLQSGLAGGVIGQRGQNVRPPQQREPADLAGGEVLGRSRRRQVEFEVQPVQRDRGKPQRARQRGPRLGQQALSVGEVSACANERQARRVEFDPRRWRLPPTGLACG